MARAGLGRSWRDQIAATEKPLSQACVPGLGVLIRLLDARGTYVAETRPGSGERVNKPRWRLFAAVVEVSGGPLFVKLVGPEREVTGHVTALREWLRSLRRARGQ